MILGGKIHSSWLTGELLHILLIIDIWFMIKVEHREGRGGGETLHVLTQSPVHIVDIA